jgi:hypothetical protein
MISTSAPAASVLIIMMMVAIAARIVPLTPLNSP